MAMKSLSPVPKLLSTTPSSVLSSSDKNFFFVDFVGLYCNKSKRTRRRLRGDSSSNSRASSLSRLSSVRAVIDLERVHGLSDKDLASPSFLKPQVRFFVSLVFSLRYFHEHPTCNLRLLGFGNEEFFYVKNSSFDDTFLRFGLFLFLGDD